MKTGERIGAIVVYVIGWVAALFGAWYAIEELPRSTFIVQDYQVYAQMDGSAFNCALGVVLFLLGITLTLLLLYKYRGYSANTVDAKETDEGCAPKTYHDIDGSALVPCTVIGKMMNTTSRIRVRTHDGKDMVLQAQGVGAFKTDDRIYARAHDMIDINKYLIDRETEN